MKMESFSETEREQGPSWARDNWPLSDLDEVNAGLDPTRMTIEKVSAKAREVAAASGKSEAETEQAAEDSIRAMMLIRTYRVRGHLAADLDPLGLAKARAAGRPHPRISRLHRRSAEPAGLSRRHDGLRDGDRRGAGRVPPAQLLRPYRP
jgi:2-oxoglutarate dehydrogenase complex dehydrogenase (E1) component-like enzyme